MASWSQAQPGGNRLPAVKSPEVTAERKLTVRIRAPEAKVVRLVGGDHPGVGEGVDLKPGEGGVWEATLEPAPAGSYRYRFDVDGLPVLDPRNPLTSQSNSNAWSLVHVPGSEHFDLRDVPHGALASVDYYSKTLQAWRRMHVYTPPGYDLGGDSYPVFYLLHGASDSDDSWSSVGRAHVILDNLIASGKAKPMLVVMPNGHTGNFDFGGGGRSFDSQLVEFKDDFLKEVMPYVESHYRVKKDRASRAIAGLSMGGAQTLNVAFEKLDQFGYVGVFSSGIFGIAGGPGGGGPNNQWETAHAQTLDAAELKEGLKLFWIACGKEDFLLQTSNATVEMFKKHKFDVKQVETEGGHTWLVWRDYLVEFTPALFQR